MSSEDVYKELNQIFKDIFDDDTIMIYDTMNTEDIENWDSLAHISLLIAIEIKFNIKFSIKEVKDMENICDMVNIILLKI